MTALCNRRIFSIAFVALVAAWPAAAQFHQIPIGMSLLPQPQQHSEHARTTYEPTSYEIIAIDPPVAWEHPRTMAHAVNNAGQVLANYSTPEHSSWHTAAIWDSGVLTTIDSAASQLGAMNELGHAVGSRVYGDRAVLWRDGQEIELNISSSPSFPHGINDSDQVVGSAIERAFFWDDGIVTMLPEQDGVKSAAKAINNAGQIVGSIHYEEMVNPNDPNNVEIFRRAVRWEQVDGQWTITVLGPPGIHSVAATINEAGDAAGGAEDSPVLYSNGTVTALTEAEGYARGMNNAGDVVGEYQPPGSISTLGTHAFLWRNGVFTDLHDLLSPTDRAIWTLWRAYDINDDGWIVGIGLLHGDWEMIRGFILRPCESVNSAAASPAVTTR